MNTSFDKHWAIVDDDTIFQYSIGRLIRSVDPSIKITPYFDGNEFLAFLNSQNRDDLQLPSDVLMDINMPMMDAWSFLEEYEKLDLFKEKSFRLHLMTSSISTEDRKLYEEKDYLGHYLVKPINEEIIKTILDKK